MLTDYEQILFIADTATLSSKKKDDARQIFVMNNGTYEWATTGPANGTSIFAASGSGFWVRKVLGTPPSSSSQAPIQFKDEGVVKGALGAINEVNYTGAGVTATAVGTVLTVDVPASGGGGGQASIQFKDEGSNVGSVGAVTSLNFAGAGVTASATGTDVTVTIPGGGGGGGGSATEAKGITIDGQGSAIVASNTSYGFVVIPYAATITGWDLQADISGSIVFDVKIGGTSIIGAGNKPTLASQQTNAATVSGWTDTSIAVNEKLEFIAVSAATLTRVTLTLFLTRI